MRLMNDMATKSESAEIAVLQSQMEDVKASLATLDTNQSSNFKILSEKLDGIPYSITAIDARLKIVERRQSRTWLSNSLSAILGAILTGMVTFIVFTLTSINK